MSELEIILFSGEGFFILFLFFYLLYREKIFSKKFSGLELGLEEMHQELFKLKKEINELKNKKENEKKEIS